MARVAIIGGGILGLAHAWSARERGHSVSIFERANRAEGASVRNFGMVWPIGQLQTEMERTAMLSRQRWLVAAEQAGCWLNSCGSLHLAHHDDEFAVLEEFVARQGSLDGESSCLLTAAELKRATTADRWHVPAANWTELRGGLWSPWELGVNPRQACDSLTTWLAGKGVAFHFRTPIVAVETVAPQGSVALLDGHGVRRSVDWVVVCSGADFQTLLPAAFDDAGLVPCKLQMLRTEPQPDGWRIGPHVASGLTLRHYANFQHCPSLAAVKRRIAEETPELDRFGIHVMMSQDDAGRVILGDSHEYGAAVEPFDKAEIDRLMMRELQRVFHLPSWKIEQRWHGVYAKYSKPVYRAEPLPTVHVCTGVGGAGMTLGFGIAEEMWREFSV